MGSGVLNDRSFYPGVRNHYLINKKTIAVGLSWAMIFSFMVIIINIIPMVRAPTIWYVDDEPGGIPSEDFTSIQEAVDAAQPGDTVHVYNGTYY